MARVPARQRREDFIRAAVEVIAEYGVGGATTRRIAEAAKAPLASLHYFFGTKEDLFYALYEWQIARFEQSYFEVCEAAGVGRTAASLLRQIADWWANDTVFAQAQEEVYLWIVRQNRDLGIKICEVNRDVLIAALQRGLHEDDDPRLVEPLANFVAAAADGILLQWLSYRDHDRLMSDLDFACEAIEVFTASRRRVVPAAAP